MKYRKLAVYLLAIFIALDYGVSYFLLKYHSNYFPEQNPIINFLIRNSSLEITFGALTILAAACIWIIYYRLWHRDHVWAWYLIVGLVVLRGLGVIALLYSVFVVYYVIYMGG